MARLFLQTCPKDWTRGWGTSLGFDLRKAANKEELEGLFAHLKEELLDCGFLRPPEKVPSMMRNIRNLFLRAQLTEQEVRTLRGIVAGLTYRHTRPKVQSGEGP